MIAQIQMRRGTTAEWAAASPVVLAAGEMGLDTTIRKSKIGDGTTEWASLPWLNGDVTNPNLLHNWDFRNPVNQRGAGFVSGANTYGLDRWKVASGGGAYNVDSGSVSNQGSFAQRIENAQWLLGKVATISICVSGVIHSRTFTIPSTVGGFITLPSIYATASAVFDITVTATSSYLDVEFIVNEAIYGIEMVKLELGTVSTLAYDPPADYGTELAKCQRYYRVFPVGTKFVGIVFSGIAYCQLQLSPPMRSIPTITSASPMTIYYSGTSGSFSPTFSTSTVTQLEFGFVVSGGGPSSAESGGIVTLSADL